MGDRGSPGRRGVDGPQVILCVNGIKNGVKMAWHIHTWAYHAFSRRL